MALTGGAAGSSCRLAAAVVFVIMLGSCSRGDSERPPGPTTTTQPASTTVTTGTSTASSSVVDEADESEVRSAYEAASRAFIDAAAIPDPDAPALAATHTGPMLEQRRKTLSALRAEGKVIRYPQPSQYQVVVESVEANGGTARLRFCAIDDGERVDAQADGVFTRRVITVRGDAALKLVDGVWRLAEQRFDSQGEGGTSCA